MYCHKIFINAIERQKKYIQLLFRRLLLWSESLLLLKICYIDAFTLIVHIGLILRPSYRKVKKPIIFLLTFFHFYFLSSKKLFQQKEHLRRLQKKSSLKNKKKILIQKGGSFLPMLLPIVLSLLNQIL